MGLKFWKAEKEMTLEESQEFRQANGSRAKPSQDSLNRKLKFSAFNSFTESQPKRSNIVAPILPQGQSEDQYSSYDDVTTTQLNDYQPYDQQSQRRQPSQSKYPSYNNSDNDFNNYNSGYKSSVGYGTAINTSNSTLPQQPQQSQQSQPDDQDFNSYDRYDPYSEYKDTGREDQKDQMTSDFQQMQLNDNSQQQQQQQQSRGETEQEFDPYGPAANLGTQEELNFNEFHHDEFGQQQHYDQQEFDSQDLNEDEQELSRIVRQTKDLREDTLQVSNNIVSNLKQGNVTAVNSLGVLGSQREKIYSMERKMNNIEDIQEETTEHIKQLDHYKRPLYHIKINNPLTKSRRARQRELAMDRKMYEQDAREDATNANLYASQNALLNQFHDDDDGSAEVSELKAKYDYERRIEEAKKYLTSDHDQEDADIENQIGKNLEDALKQAEKLKLRAVAMNEEISKQNADLQNMAERTTKANHRVLKSTSRLRGI